MGLVSVLRVFRTHTVVILCSVWLTLSVRGSAWACSIEIWPIAKVVPSAHIIAVGVVDSVKTEVFYQDEESGFTVLSPVWVIIQVDYVLKGNLEPGPLRLSFWEGIGGSSCDFLLAPYQVGNRLLLMVTEQKEDAYFAPLVPPRVIVLGETASAADTPLLEFVEHTIAYGTPPIQIQFHGSTRFLSSEQVGVPLTITNQMADQVIVASTPVGWNQPLPSGTVIWFELCHRGGDRVEPIPGRTEGLPSSVSVAPRQTEHIVLGLTANYQLTEPDRYHLYMNTRLSTSSEEPYVDFWPSAFSFLLGEPTNVSPITWGQLKQNLMARP